jgi:hypothetical protein
MDLGLGDKVAIVTGGSDGLGRPRQAAYVTGVAINFDGGLADVV